MSQQASQETILEVRDLVKEYNRKKVLKKLSFEIYEGEILSFIGPNGAGKTTLLKILSGFLTSDSGAVYISQKEVTNQLDLLNKKVSTVFGGGNGFYKNASVVENLFFFASLMGLRRHTIPEKIKHVLKQVELTEHQDKKVGHLSMGMLQRLHIARGLLKDSPILLLDEPTNGVDAEISHSLRKIIKNIAQHGTAVILTSHILQEVSDLSDQIFLLYHGEIMFSGDLSHIIAASGVAYIDRPATLEESYLGLLAKIGGNHA